MGSSFSDTAHWRDSSRTARFFTIDARAAFPLFFFLMHIRLWTGLFALATIVIFGIIEHMGFTLPVFIRWVRSFLAGPRKVSVPWWKS